VINSMQPDRTLRIFLSSTFRDFGEERDLLVKRVFPALRARLRDRFVELVDIDLRWGITVEEAERGEVLPICLAEIDRSRPYFIGMLGERYGWIPPPEGYAPDLLERQPWLKSHQGGKSVTELEILHGVLNNRRMRGKAFFYFRSSAYARTKGGDYLPSPEDRARQSELKRRIRERGLPVVSYANPEALAKRIERDLWKLLDAEFPASSVPDAFEREVMRHEAYAFPRRRLYLGGERYQAALQKLLDVEEPRIVIEGASGGGKSALLANFFDAYRKRHRRHLVHEHYLGASADAADPHALVRRLIEFIHRATGSTEEIPGDPQKLMDSLPLWLATASAWGRRRKTRFIFVLDSFNSLTNQQDLRWWPAFLPRGITMVVSCLPGPVHDALKGKTEALPGQDKPPKWKAITVRPLTKPQSATLLNTYLARFNKKLAPQMVKQVQRHPLATNPLFLRTLAEELRLFGVHEELQKRLDHYLASETIDDLFERVLERVEKDCGKKQVKAAMTAIWASRAGLSETEILGIAQLTPVAWATMRHMLDEALLETNGRIAFAHDYLRIAVRDRHLTTREKQAHAHRHIAQWFRQRPVDARRAEEEPWQWVAARGWRELKNCVSEAPMFMALEEAGGPRSLQVYWRVLRENVGTDMTKALSAAWRRWSKSAEPEESGRLAMAVAKLLNYCSQYQGALKIARLGVAILSSSVGEDKDETRKARNVLGTILTSLSMYRDSTIEHEKVMASCGSQPLRAEAAAAIYADAMNFAACNAYYLNDYASALPRFEWVLKYRRENLGIIHEQTIEVANNIANVYLETGKYEMALQLHTESVTVARKGLGDDHPSMGLYLSNHANALEKSGDLQSALTGYQRAIAIYEKTLGSMCSDLVVPLGNLGLLHHRLGNQDQARDLLQRCLKLVCEVLGRKHRQTVRALVNLAVVTAEPADRRTMLFEACAVAREVLGDHVMTAAACGQLAWVLADEGDLATAESMLLEAHAIFAGIFPAGHHHVTSALYALAQFCYYQLDDDNRALQYLELFFEQQSGMTGEAVTLVPDVCMMASWIMSSRDEVRAARDFLKKGLTYLDRIHGAGSAHHPAYLLELSQLEARDGNPDKALVLLAQVDSIAESSSDSSAQSLIEMLYDLGQIFEQKNETKAALKAYERCLAVMEQSYEPSDLVFVNLLVVIAAVRESAGDQDGALLMRERVENLFQAHPLLDEGRIEQRDFNRAALERLKMKLARENQTGQQTA
jgi:nephrocystin-3